MAPKKSLRPKERKDRPYLPEHEMTSTSVAVPDAIEPKSSVRPKMRPRYMEEEAAAVKRGRRGSEYEAEDYMIGKEEYAKGGKVDGFPDLNKDGKVTKADVLKGRGVEGFMGGGKVKGYKNGGCVMAGRGGSFKGMK